MSGCIRRGVSEVRICTVVLPQCDRFSSPAETVLGISRMAAMYCARTGLHVLSVLLVSSGFSSSYLVTWCVMEWPFCWSIKRGMPGLDGVQEMTLLYISPRCGMSHMFVKCTLKYTCPVYTRYPLMWQLPAQIVAKVWNETLYKHNCVGNIYLNTRATCLECTH